MLGKLSWAAIPFNEPLPLISVAVVAVVILVALAIVTIKGWWPYVWREWLTSVDHKRIGVRETPAYRASVLPPEVKARVALEQASTFGWERYVGPTGRVIGMHTFGASAPLKALQQKFGFTVENVVAAAKEQLAQTDPVH